jgi:DNA-binding MarR family transcriptional regulator
MKKGEVKSLFLQEKPVRVLSCLKKEDKPLYVAIIAKEVDSTYAHTLNVLSELERLKLVSFKQTGRIKLVKLTELGAAVAKTLENFIDLVRLASIEARVDQLYGQEVKGRLREEMDKRRISVKLMKCKKEVEQSIGEGKPQEIVLFAKKLVKKIDGVAAEVMGYPPA